MKINKSIRDRNLELLGLKEGNKLKNLQNEAFRQGYKKEILKEDVEEDFVDLKNERVEEFEQKKFTPGEYDDELYDLRKTFLEEKDF